MATTPYPFVAATVLTASQLNSTFNVPVSAQTASYTLVAADAGTRVQMNNASATTITVNTSLFSAGDNLFIQNIGAGTCTITAGTATVSTSGSLALAQFGGGTLYFTSASAAIFFSGSGSAYGTATGGIGAPTAVTINSVNYQYLTFNATGTLTVTKAGFFDYLAIGGGNGSTQHSGGNGAGGGAGAIVIGSIFLSANQTVTIGAGSAFAQFATLQQAGNTSIAATSPFTQTASGAVSKNDASNGNVMTFTGSGNGCIGNSATTVVQTIYGFNGGSSSGGFGGGGGGFLGAGVSGATTSNGGAGFDIAVFIGGSALFKASGGGGGGRVSSGGSSLGNNGTANTTPSNGAANTGCGGGAGSGTQTTGNGGSGICFLRFTV